MSRCECCRSKYECRCEEEGSPWLVALEENRVERALWSRLYAALTGDSGAYSPADLERVVGQATARRVCPECGTLDGGLCRCKQVRFDAAERRAMAAEHERDEARAEAKQNYESAERECVRAIKAEAELAKYRRAWDVRAANADVVRASLKSIGEYGQDCEACGYPVVVGRTRCVTCSTRESVPLRCTPGFISAVASGNGCEIRAADDKPAQPAGGQT